MTARSALPLTVIGGFLGAGKTTLLNRWLRESQGQRLAVLVNDFGALNIDAGLVAGAAGDGLIALTNGCVCCTIGDDLSAALMRVLARADDFDAVVVEASGVSDPWRIAQFAIADPALSLDGVVVLVDGAAASAQWDDPLLADTFERQLRSAGVIVLNKGDLAEPAALAALRARIERLVPGVTIIATRDAEVPLAVLTRLAIPAPPAEVRDHDHAHDHDHGDHGDPHHGALFDTWSARPTGVFDTGELRRWMHNAPAGLLRLKGVVRTGAGTWAEVQFAGRHGSVRAARPPADGAAVVAIGLRGTLPQAELDALFIPEAERR